MSIALSVFKNKIELPSLFSLSLDKKLIFFRNDSFDFCSYRYFIFEF